VPRAISSGNTGPTPPTGGSSVVNRFGFLGKGAPSRPRTFRTIYH
jgi:hypothetical protein